MKTESALALTPAAIIRLANVCRHSCSVIGSQPRRSPTPRRDAVADRVRRANGL